MAKSYRLNRFVGISLARYFRFVARTSRMMTDMDKHFDDVAPNLPAIFTFWHGEQYLIPTAVAGRISISVLVSRHGDGEIQAAALESFDIPTVRGSGGRDRAKTIKKGGIQGALEILSRLESGISVAMTANVPHGPSRDAGKGVAMLAKMSGRPVYPVCLVTNKSFKLETWDNSVINLPFSRSAFGLGKPIWVGGDADEKEISSARKQIGDELTRITREAHSQVKYK